MPTVYLPIYYVSGEVAIRQTIPRNRIAQTHVFLIVYAASERNRWFFYQIIIKLTWDVLDITEEFTSEFAGAKFAVEKG